MKRHDYNKHLQGDQSFPNIPFHVPRADNAELKSAFNAKIKSDFGYRIP